MTHSMSDDDKGSSEGSSSCHMDILVVPGVMVVSEKPERLCLLEGDSVDQLMPTADLVRGEDNVRFKVD